MNAQISTTKLRAPHSAGLVMAIALCLYSSAAIKAQATNATTPDNQVYPSNTICYSSCYIFPHANLGVGVNYLVQYANSGAFKTEYLSEERITWVSDYELNNANVPDRAIAHWNHANGGATGYTPLYSSGVVNIIVGTPMWCSTMASCSLFTMQSNTQVWVPQSQVLEPFLTINFEWYWKNSRPPIRLYRSLTPQST